MTTPIDLGRVGFDPFAAFDFGSAKGGAEPQAAPVANSPQPLASVQGAAFRDVLARYDVTDISPREFSELLTELHQAQAITDAQFQELSSMRVELDQANLDPDGRLNLIDFFQRKLRREEQQLSDLEQKKSPVPLGREDSLRGTLRQIDWLKKFAVAHASGYQPLDSIV
jgi:hypothetical protein